ncbi:MAG: recombinase family protein [Candidatus Obscuribacter sp.]|jgi:putative DNA-invertase from lambdoid prophage Rac|nr:recombinase family protein [Candidatus Obscuribacter sp.]MBK9281481.1 recombinase family protein [Candidatus Obscuribacter sp.]
MRVGIYARVSTNEQRTLPMQLKALRKYVRARNWKVALEVEDIGSGVKERKKREQVMDAARRREIDVVLVWKLDRWGRSIHDLFMTMKELTDLDVIFVSLTEAVDLSSPVGRAVAGLLTVFANFERELLRERVKAGIAYARKRGKRHGRPASVTKYATKVRKLFAQGVSKAEIARQLSISRTSVRRLLLNSK